MKGLFLNSDKTCAVIGCDCGDYEHGQISHLEWEENGEVYTYVTAGFSTNTFSLRWRIKHAWAMLRGRSISHDFIASYETLVELGEWAKERIAVRDAQIAAHHAKRDRGPGVSH